MYVFKCVSESRFNFIIALTTHISSPISLHQKQEVAGLSLLLSFRLFMLLCVFCWFNSPKTTTPNEAGRSRVLLCTNTVSVDGRAKMDRTAFISHQKNTVKRRGAALRRSNLFSFITKGTL